MRASSTMPMHVVQHINGYFPNLLERIVSSAKVFTCLASSLSTSTSIPFLPSSPNHHHSSRQFQTSSFASSPHPKGSLETLKRSAFNQQWPCSIAHIQPQGLGLPRPHGSPMLGPSRSPAHKSPFMPNLVHQPGGSRGFFDISQAIQNLKYDFQDPERSCTNSIILLNVAAWLVSCINPGIIGLFAQNTYAIARGEYYRLFTSTFMHSSITHLGLNMLAVHWLAPPVEMACGRSVFLLIYVLSGAGGAFAHYYLGSASSYVLGSSGAIAGLFAAFLMYKWRNRDTVGFTEADKNWALQMVGLNVMLGLAFSGSLAHFAHVGGAVGGALSMWIFGPRYVREWGQLVNKPIVPLPKGLQ